MIISSRILRNILQYSWQYKRALSVKCKKLITEEYGDPMKVVKMTYEELNEPKQSQVLVKILAAPVNPADINTIQGTYAVKPPLPTTLGNEGVGEVIATGTDTKFVVGDRVIPRLNAMGTWSSHMLVEDKNLIQIPPHISVVDAATIAVNPCTAYRILKDYVDLHVGDTIIQNGANSAVGQAVIQIATAMGLNSINIIRDRPNLDEIKEYLTSLGATVVLTEKELRSNREMINNIPKPILGLNCTGGSAGLEVVRQLDHGGVMVTYGGMSREPVKVPVGSLIFTDITLKGFWMTRWNSHHVNDERRENMFNNLFTLICQGSLRAPKHKLIHLDDYKSAIENAMPRQGMVDCKQILTME